MPSVIALGELASDIAEGFRKYDQYEIYKISVGITDSVNTKNIPKLSGVEEYEKYAPDCASFFANTADEVLFICTGAEPESGATLRILEQLQGKEITCMFLKSEQALISTTEKMQERVGFNVLQQYARSGMLDRMYLIDMPLVDEINGDVSILEYTKKQAESIATTYHMTQVFMNTQPIMGNMLPPQMPNKISTLGVTSIGEKDDKWFFSLDKAFEKYYLYAVSSELLEKDKQLLGKIKTQIKERTEENTEVMYGIFTTNYADNFVFCLANTKFIQGEKNS